MSIPATASRGRTTRGAAIAFAAAALALLVQVVPGSLGLVGEVFPGFLVWDNGVLVSLHRSSWTGARLPLNGGVVVEVQGQPFSGGRELWEQARSLAPGTPLVLEVRHGGRSSEYAVSSMRLGARDYAFTLGIYLLNAGALLLVGALALLLRPDLAATRALAASTGILAALLVLSVDYVTAYRWIAACRVAEALAPAALLNLALVFPVERLRSSRRHASVAALAIAVLTAHLLAGRSFYERPELARLGAECVYVLISLSLLALIANYAVTLLRAGEPRRRAQAAIVFAGGLPAFTLSAFGMLAFTLLGWSFSWSWFFALLPLAPISMLYAMVAQDLFDAERFVRLSAGYVISSAGVLAGYAGGLALLDRTVSGVSADRGASFVLLLAIALFFDPLRRWVQAAIDRAFYRSRVDVARALEHSSADLVELQSEQAIADYIVRRLRELLALERVELRPDGGPQPGDALCQEVAIAGQPLAVIACGPKRSAAPFSSQETDLVKGLADQAALAIHSARSMARLREAERALRVNERLAAIGEFSGAVAHGLRNPLAAIRVAAEVAEQHTRDGSPAGDSLELIRGEIDRLERRIRTLLQFSRPHELDRRPTPLCELVADVARVARAHAGRHGVAIGLELPEQEVFWNVDPNALREVLLELASNAVQAMHGGGRLTLRVRAETGAASILVSDTGPGIAAEDRERVFDLFYTTRREGTGIGLASARKIVEAHGGTIAIEAAAGGGAAFQIHFGAFQSQ